MGADNPKHNVVIRSFLPEEDYDMIVTWWHKLKKIAPLPEHLSQTGMVVEYNGNPVCAGFMYKTDSSICLFEFQITNPDAAKGERDAGIDVMIEAAKKWAELNGFSVVFSSVESSKFVSRLKKTGFWKGGSPIAHMFYEVV